MKPSDAAGNPIFAKVKLMSQSTTRMFNPADLQPHAQNVRLYGDRVEQEMIDSVVKHGVLVPLIIAHDTRIISGHRRWHAAKKAGLTLIPGRLFDSTDDLDILEALIESNRQRRKTRDMIAAEARQLIEIERERAKRRQGTRNDAVFGTIAAPQPALPHMTEHVGNGAMMLVGDDVDIGPAREIVGEKLGLSGRTVQTAVKVAEGIERFISDGDFDSAEEVKTVLNARGYKPALELVEVKQGRTDKMAVHHSSKSAEHYTPVRIIRAVQQVLGDVVDLDPCSNSHDDPNFPARMVFTIQDNGLVQNWSGTVFMNPPYGAGIGKWIKKLISSYEDGDVTEAVTLLPSRPGSVWYRTLRNYWRCEIHGRLKFQGNPSVAPFPSVVVYMGDNPDMFHKVFSQIGDIYRFVSAEEVALLTGRSKDSEGKER